MKTDMNCLSYWYPRIQGIDGVEVPRTSIIETKLRLTQLLDGKTPEPAGDETFAGFIDKIVAAVERHNGNAFLRTGQGSGKHDWERTCFLKQPDRETIIQHVTALVEWSEMVDMLGLPTNVWVVREMLPTVPIFHAFKGMPVTRERRYFVSDGRVVCHHSYWPEDALASWFDRLAEYPKTAGEVPADWRGKLAEINVESPDEVALLAERSERVAKVIGGQWSIDWLQTKWGWFLTDMAVAGDSYHLPGCDKAGMFKRSEM